MFADYLPVWYDFYQISTTVIDLCTYIRLRSKHDVLGAQFSDVLHAGMCKHSLLMF